MRCFAVAVAEGSSLDRYTNNFSLFQLFEQFRPSAYPASLPVYLHAFLELDAGDQGVEHEVRILLLHGGNVVFASVVLSFRPEGERHRVRVRGLTFPEPGLYSVALEWRRKAQGEAQGAGEEPWTREPVRWPIRADVPLQ